MIRVRSLRSTRPLICSLLNATKSRNFCVSRCLKNDNVSSSHLKPLSQTTQDEGFDSTKKYSNTPCTSCGITLQTTDPDKTGYYIKPREEKIRRRHQSRSLQFASALSKIDDEGRKLLGMSIESYNNEIPQKPKEEEALLCKRCHDALYHSVYNPEEHLPMKYQEVIDSIPKSANILQVFSAYDFPLSLVRVKNRSDVTYTMNKSDLLFGHGSTSGKYHDYFKKMVYRLTGSKNKLMIISAYTNWGVSELFKSLKAVNYMVGYVNAGKTRLCNRLINFGRQVKSPGSKMLKNEGSSHLPALTRENIVHECLDKTVIDVPGFLEEDGVFKHLKADYLKEILEGKKVIVSDLKDESYFTVKGQNCLTFGGVFFMIPPKDSILQVKSVCKGETSVYKDLSKAIEIVKSPPESLEKSVYVKPEAMDDLVRYVIPPFMGTIDLIIKDIGYIQIKPTGAKTNDDLFEVWAPKGVVLGVRETIEHFLTRYEKKFSKKVKVNKRGQSIQRLKMAAKQVPDYKIFSKLYEISPNSQDPLTDMKVQYEQHLKENKHTFHRWTQEEERDTSRNEYWIEKL